MISELNEEMITAKQKLDEAQSRIQLLCDTQMKSILESQRLFLEEWLRKEEEAGMDNERLLLVLREVQAVLYGILYDIAEQENRPTASYLFGREPADFALFRDMYGNHNLQQGRRWIELCQKNTYATPDEVYQQVQKEFNV